MSFFNMFGGAPKQPVEEEVKSIQEEEVPQRGETAFVTDSHEVLTPLDQEVQKEEKQIPENWREQA